MHKKLTFVLGLGVALYQLPVQAAVLGSSAFLPQSIQSCLDQGDCSVAEDSVFDAQGIAAFNYQEDDFSGYLLRYTLATPSSATDISESVNINPASGSTAPAPEITPLDGSVWLQVAKRYVNGSGKVSLYFDQVTPLEKSVVQRLGATNDYPSVLHFQLSADGFTNAGAFERLVLDANGSHESGDLVAAEPLPPCLAQGCSTFQELNLLGIQFVAEDDDLVLQFAGDDKRHKLYTETSAYSGNLGTEYHSREYFISSVPLPGAWLLWLTGVATLARRFRGSLPG